MKEDNIIHWMVHPTIFKVSCGNPGKNIKVTRDIKELTCRECLIKLIKEQEEIEKIPLWESILVISASITVFILITSVFSLILAKL